MSTVISYDRAADLPRGAVPVRPQGLLAGVQRPCQDHRCDCRCVARTPEGRLVFWCEGGAHHFTAC